MLCAGIIFYEGSVGFFFQEFFLCHKIYECCSISQMVKLMNELASRCVTEIKLKTLKNRMGIDTHLI